MENRITKLFNIKYPIVQGGMIWCAPWQLASAVSNAGGLGIIGSGSMYPEILKEHIQKCKSATNNPFAVNVALIYPAIEEHLQIIIDEGVKIVFTSAGNPKTYTSYLKERGMTVVHVVPGAKYAVKSQDAGVDAVVAEGFEAGGHNGREETTTLCLIPKVCKDVDIPVIAAGGIATGKGMLAVMQLGADGVQMGSRFVASEESSAHLGFKQTVMQVGEGGTSLTLKELTPVRLIKNEFYQKLAERYHQRAGVDDLKELLGRGRAKKGMFEGDLVEGELEIGQISSLINDIKPAAKIVEDIVKEYKSALNEIETDNKFDSWL